MAFGISQIYMHDGSIAVSELSVCWIYDGSIRFMIGVLELIKLIRYAHRTHPP